jgi:exopolysaccharide biosynthesis protein
VDKKGHAFISNAAEYNKSLRGKLEYAVGGGMRLIQDGEIFLYGDPLGASEAKAPRTAVGFDADGTAILLCADGRTKHSGGLSLADEIDIYQQLGDIRELLNLDGGGSTTVVLREDGEYRVKNIPSGSKYPFSGERYGYENQEPTGDELARGVADAILVIPKT